MSGLQSNGIPVCVCIRLFEAVGPRRISATPDRFPSTFTDSNPVEGLPCKVIGYSRPFEDHY